MRMMLKVSLPTPEANAAICNGTFATTLQQILGELKPEAAYFLEEDGVRTGLIFIDMKDSSQLPTVAEPFFLAFNAKVTARVAMNSQDLAASMPAMEKAVKTYGKKA
jgi:hypothetical protein